MLLSQLTAFRDPLKKKSGAFLLTVHFSGLWTITDQHNLEPMIDYHRIRLLCRTGCIRVIDDILERSLESRQPVPGIEEVEIEMRSGAAEVCRRLVDLTGFGMFECDNLLWAHARSCCQHQPVCIGGTLEDNSFYSLIDKRFEGRCEFQCWCAGFTDPGVRGIWEPATDTENY